MGISCYTLGDITRDAQETVAFLQGLVTRVMARKMKEEYKEKMALFEKTFQDLDWHVLEGKEEDLEGTKYSYFPWCK